MPKPSTETKAQVIYNKLKASAHPASIFTPIAKSERWNQSQSTSHFTIFFSTAIIKTQSKRAAPIQQAFLLQLAKKICLYLVVSYLNSVWLSNPKENSSHDKIKKTLEAKWLYFNFSKIHLRSKPK